VTRRSCTIKPGKTLRLQVTLEDVAAAEEEALYIEIVSKEKTLRVPAQVG